MEKQNFTRQEVLDIIVEIDYKGIDTEAITYTQILDTIVNKLGQNKAINYNRCCITLKIRELMTFEDYKNNLFIKADGVYQPKKSKIFRWYSEKQLKKMYNYEPL